MDSLPGQSNQPPQHDVVACDDGSDTEVAIQEIERVVVDNPQVLKRILDNPKTVSVIEKREFFRGPLPHPRQLKQYNDTLPGAAERIFQLTEKEQAHRHASETTALKGAISSDRRGQWMAFILSLAVFALGGTLIWLKEYTAGVALISTTVIGLAGVFALGRKGNRSSVASDTEKPNESNED
ncbi:DUF2335 domain-containing protein [Morganella morganii]|uniref:DUF2335 domain-containing protein n=1 Tax=Morganella morganii TaxID=582 RepID=UPI000DE6FE94|nr:DUF2335 domain-containing protein [Morganella morganii]SSN07390.1 Predicted membrane protein [Klebsiella pneumoniae]EJG2207384.1 DUF2335 domain-containing protein [Morganella morganii]ELA7703358.1 DUF2335 domain-containing protein [Morganella morganii]MBS9585718.1 DUF2335 domain-containing protein [Morganella morganii subsp. morganii]MBT0432684.1 DUF2335 domain-containing protein [Morganella morganii subsp. morganii]